MMSEQIKSILDERLGTLARCLPGDYKDHDDLLMQAMQVIEDDHQDLVDSLGIISAVTAVREWTDEFMERER